MVQYLLVPMLDWMLGYSCLVDLLGVESVYRVVKPFTHGRDGR